MLCAISFYAGISVGLHVDKNETPQCWTEKDPRFIELVKKKVNQKLRKHQKQSLDSAIAGDEPLRIPEETLGKVATGMGRIARDRFAEKFEMVRRTHGQLYDNAKIRCLMSFWICRESP